MERIGAVIAVKTAKPARLFRKTDMRNCRGQGILMRPDIVVVVKVVEDAR